MITVLIVALYLVLPIAAVTVADQHVNGENA